jgi:hypothetical protein
MISFTQGYFADCVEDLNLPKEWENISYGNDVCPSYLYKGYVIFIDHKDKNKREVMDQYRFLIMTFDSTMESYNTDYNLLQTDSFKKVLSFLNTNT